MAKAKKIDFDALEDDEPPVGPTTTAATNAPPHPIGVLLVLKNRTRAWIKEFDALWTIPAPVITGKQVTFTFSVGSVPVNTPMRIYWGDGASNTYNITGASLGASHTYALAGTYAVRVEVGPDNPTVNSVKTTSVTVA